MKLWKKGFLATPIAVLLCLIVATPAQADVIGGGGSSSGGDLSAGGLAPSNWDRVVGIWDPNGAYDDFQAAAQGNGRYGLLNSNQKVDERLNAIDRSGQLLQGCRGARLILFLRDENYGAWIAQPSGFGLTDEVKSGNWKTRGEEGNGHVYIENRNTGDDMRQWERSWALSNGGSKTPKNEAIDYARSAPTNTSIICAWGTDVILPSTSTFSRQQATVGDSYTANHPVSWTTAVTAETNDKDGVDRIGKNNLKDQAAVTVKSEFGKVYDGLRNGQTVNETRDKINQALQADKNAARAEVTLSDNNQAGLAEGGVLSVTERTALSKVDVSQTDTWQRCIQVSREQRFNGSSWQDVETKNEAIDWNARCDNAPIRTNRSWTAGESGNGEFPKTETKWRKVETQASTSKTPGTPYASGAWQILSVHCNPDELAAVLATLGGDYVATQTQAAGVDGKSTYVITTAKMDPTNDAQRALYNKNKLGDGSSTNSALARTGEVGFYDKECNITCTMDPNASSGASSANGAVNNVSTETSVPAKDFLGGATIGNNNSNFQQVFRDNENRTIKINSSYPAPGTQFGYSGAAPKSTTFNLWGEGTPRTQPVKDGSGKITEGGVFSIQIPDGTGKFKNIFGTAGTPAPQKNWSVDRYSTETSATVAGFHNEFVVKSTWASNSDRPQVLNVKWEYETSVPTTIPSKVGFAGGGGKLISGTTIRNAAIDGRCYAEYGTGAQTNELKSILNTAVDASKFKEGGRIAESTGSGTENIIDGSLISGASGDNSYQYSTNLVLKFVRAVSE